MLQGKNNCISSLKGIAILGIVLVHYGLMTSNRLIGGMVANGARGVQIMFIMNAFLIWNSLDKIELNRKAMVGWWKNKYIRLIPLYYFFTILHLIIFGTGGRYYLGTYSEVSAINIIANLMFLHGFHPYYINAININWFMADIAIFYLVAPFLYRIINSLEKACISLGAYAMIWFFVQHGMLKLHIIDIQSIWEDYINILCFPAEFSVILLGIVAYYIWRDVLCKIQYKRIFSYICLIGCIILSMSLFLRKGYFIVYSDIFSFGIIFILLFLGQMVFPCKLIVNRLFDIFGKHSYGIYLSHIFMIELFKVLDIRGDSPIIAIRVGGFVAVVVAALLISIITENLIEKPVTRYIKNFLQVKSRKSVE